MKHDPKADRSDPQHPGRRLAYLSAQSVVDGQDTWAAVMEVVRAIEDIGWKVDLYRPVYASSQPGLLERVWRIGAEQMRLIRRLESYDALYVRAHPLAWVTAAYARKKGVPVVQESNGSWDDAFIAWPVTRSVSGVVKSLQRSQYRHADRVIAVSQSLADWIAAQTGRTDIVVSGNGANLALFCPQATSPAGLPERFVVFFGQLAEWQRIDVLLSAASHPDWPQGVDVVVVGDGKERSRVEAAARELDHVHYLGRLPYAQVPGVVANALAAAVLTYAPDRAGYSPLKLYEAMACGVPVVCSDTVGQAEVVREEGCGIVVPPGDAAGVARAVRALAEDPEGAREMGRRGCEAVWERYSWAARARQRLDVVEDALREKTAER